MWITCPTAPPWTWNLNQPGVFIERLFLAHWLWHCTHAQRRHAHTYVLLKPAVVTPRMYQPFLGTCLSCRVSTHVGGNAEWEISMLEEKKKKNRKRRAQGVSEFYRFSYRFQDLMSAATPTKLSNTVKQLLTFRAELISMMEKYRPGQKCLRYVWQIDCSQCEDQ